MDEIQWEAINVGSYLPARTVNIPVEWRGAVDMMHSGYSSLLCSIRMGGKKKPLGYSHGFFFFFVYLISSPGG